MKWDHCAYCIQIFWSGSYFYLGPDHLWLWIFNIKYSIITKLHSDLESSAYIITWKKFMILNNHKIQMTRGYYKLQMIRAQHLMLEACVNFFLSAVFLASTTKNGVTKWRNQLYNTIHIKKIKWLIMMINLILVIWLWSMAGLIIYSHDWNKFRIISFLLGLQINPDSWLIQDKFLDLFNFLDNVLKAEEINRSGWSES